MLGLQRLVTKEDPLHVHKTLGILCLTHFAFRFAKFGHGDMGFDPSIASAMCLLLHALLSCSSLAFRIPEKRIMEGSRIWPEFRLHSIVFACRHIACMLVTWAEARWGGRTDRPMFSINPLIVLSTLLLADAATRRSSGVKSSTIGSLRAPAAMRFFFSAMQFHGTVACLVGVRRFSMQLVMLFTIQITAFLMTLRRKNIVGHTPIVYFYGALLAFGKLVGAHDMSLFACQHGCNALANLAILARIGLRMNKYVIWIGMAGAATYLRATTGLACNNARAIAAWKPFWQRLHWTTLALVVVLGVYKVQFDARCRYDRTTRGRETPVNRASKQKTHR